MVRLQNNPTASSVWVAGHLLVDVNINSSTDIKGMASTSMIRYGLLTPKHMLRNAKNKIIKMMEGK